MLPEKHNDSHSWKNKLEGLTGLPGEAWKKNVAWEKLHSRLQERPSRSKAVWYWAAACLLLALTIPLLIPNKKENIEVRNVFAPKKQTIVLPTPPAVPVTDKAAAPVEKMKINYSDTKDQHTADVKTIVKQEKQVTAIAETIIEKDPVPIITDTAAALVAATPVKKKMPVVHINELEPSTAQFYPLPNYAQKSFKIKFKNGKAANQTIASQQQYEGGFKIKLSPKN
ncbi:MAG: hypothetical protein ABIN74_06805 [Ferruginibacter sp.]